MEYICQVDEFKKLAKYFLTVPSAILAIPFLYFSERRWTTIERLLPLGLDNDKEMSKNLTKGVFGNLDSAKKFIDGYIKENQENELLKIGNGIKYETYIEYP